MENSDACMGRDDTNHKIQVRDAASRPDMADEMTKVAEEVAEEVWVRAACLQNEAAPEKHLN